MMLDVLRTRQTQEDAAVLCVQGSYSDLYPDSDDSTEDQIENSKNSWSCKVASSPVCPLLSVSL